MPKLFKPNTLAHSVDQPTPEVSSHTTTPETPPSAPIEHHNTEPMHPDFLSEHLGPPKEEVMITNFTQHARSIDQPTEFQFKLPEEEEPLLPSPLDTPELPPAHTHLAAHHEESNPTPVFKPQPALDPISGPPLANNSQSMPFSTAPLPESKMVETLLQWNAASRPHRKRNRSFYTTVAVLIILIAMIALLAGEKMLVAVLFALMFLVYVLNFIEPGEIQYKISTQGVTIDEHFYHWQELDSFWIEKKDGFTVLHILTQLRFPSMLMLVVADTVSEDQLKKTVARFLPFHEIAPKSVLEKWAESLQKYFPLENPHK